MPTLSEAVAKFVAIKRASMKSDATLRWYESLLGSFMREGSNPHADVTSISEDTMLDYFGEMRSRDSRYLQGIQKPKQAGGLSRASIASHIRANRAFWRWAAKRYDMDNPMQEITVPKKASTPPKAIAPQDFVKLFDVIEETSQAPHRDRAILALLADSGVRRGGICTMRVQDVDLAHRGAWVTEKGNKRRWVIWTRYTSELIAKWLAVRPATSCEALFTSISAPDEALREGGYNQLLKRLKKASGVRGRVNPHSFRHGFAKQYLKSGGDLSTLSMLMGHTSSDTTTQFYAVFTRSELSEMQRKNSPLLRMLEVQDE